MDFLAIIFTVIFIIGILIIILLIVNQYDLPLPKPDCTRNQDCANGGICQSGVCKVPIGGTCSQLSDCVLGAITCYNSVCISNPKNGIDEPCPCMDGYQCQYGFCKVAPQGQCASNDDCLLGYICSNDICILGPTGPTGSTCGATGPTGATGYVSPSSSMDLSSGFVTEDESIDSTSTPTSNVCMTTEDCSSGYICLPRNVYYSDRKGKMVSVIRKDMIPGENAIDITTNQGELYVLYQGGDLFIVEDGVPKEIKTSLTFTRIIGFNGRLYGLARGNLYYQTEEGWKPESQIKDTIYDVSVTLNGKHLWVSSLNKGYLYNRRWEIVETVKITYQTPRVYGVNKKEYMNITSKTQLQTSDQTKYVYTKAYAFDQDGNVVIPNNKDIYLLRYLNYQGSWTLFYILERSCVPA